MKRAGGECVGASPDKRRKVSNPKETYASGGSYHSAVIDTDGSLWMWGNNQHGQLGVETKKYQNIPKQVPTDYKIKFIACGCYHSASIDIHGSLWLWGRNNHFQVAEQNTPAILTPTKLQLAIPFETVSCGYAHTLALDIYGKVWAWGNNEQGQLGVGKNINVQRKPLQIQTNNTDFFISFITCGYYHSVAIDPNGSTWSWGNNEHGQLGIGSLTDASEPTIISTLSNVKMVSCGAYHTISIDSSGDLWGWGWNSLGQIGVTHGKDELVPTRVQLNEKVQSISCGYSHTIAVGDNGEMWGWGYNENGELGIGELVSESRVPQLISVSGLKEMQYTSSGGNHSIVIDASGKIWVFGWNEEGQLGTGNWDDAYYPVALTVPITVPNRCLLRGQKTKSSRNL